MSIHSNIEWAAESVACRAFNGQVDLTYGKVGNGGPNVLITAGIHGDEGPWSCLAVDRLLRRTPLDMLSGSLTFIPVTNPTAYELDSRVSPLDHLDLNRQFPGDPEGSHSQRLAYEINRLSEGVDAVIDLHGGGSWCVNSFAFSFPGSEQMALDFNPPFIVNAPVKHGTLSGMCRERGVKVTGVEMGGRSRHEKAWIDRLSQGLGNCLARLGVLDMEPIDYEPLAVVKGTERVNASSGGLFVPTVDEDMNGTIIPEGVELGRILDPVTMDTLQTFVSPHPRNAVLLLRPRVTVIEGGDMVYVLAPVEDSE